MLQLIKGIVDTQKNNYRSIGQVSVNDDLELELEVKMNCQSIQFLNPQAELLIKKADGNRVRQTKDILYKDGKFKIKVDEQGVTYPGITTNQLIINDDGRVSTCLFYFNVGTSLDREVLQSISKIEVLEEIDKYIAQAFANLDEYEKRIIAGDETIRNLNNDINEAEKSRGAAEQKREEFKLLLESKLENGEFIGATGKQGPQGIQGERGPQGEQGPKGETGPQGPIGEQGPQGLPGKDGKNGLDGTNGQDGVTPKIQVGTVTTLEAGQQATVVNSGTKENPIFDFAIPRGENGADGITPDMTEFKNQINEQYETIINKNNTFKEEIVNENNTFKEEMNIDFGNAKTDYFGEEHLNVVDRLTSDFDNVHQRINDSSYLAYEGTNITADNSYYGYVKEMSVKGRTLQNLKSDLQSLSSGYVVTDDSYSLDIEYGAGQPQIRYNLTQTLKQGTEYTLIANVLNYEKGRLHMVLVQKGQPDIVCSNEITTKEVGVVMSKFTTNTKGVADLLRVIPWNGDANKWTISKNIILLEGDYTNTPLEDIPFGEGIYSVGENEVTEEGKYPISVKSCGKNVVNLDSMTKTISGNINSKIGSWDSSYYYSNIDISALKGVYTLSAKNFINGTVVACKFIASKNETDKTTHGSIYSTTAGKGSYYGKELNSGTSFDLTEYDFLHITPSNNENFGLTTLDISISDIQIEKGTKATEYEQYQGSVQELQLTEPLRSLPNGVCDEITEDGTEIRRVGKVVLDGSENWRNGVGTNESFIDVRLDLKQLVGKNNRNGLCDTLPYASYIDAWICTKEGISVFNHATVTEVIASIPKTKVIDLQSWKDWLSQNPTTLYYELIEPIITKHNLNINLKTFEGTTHITSDNYLQPTLSCKVPTNVQATITSLMLENESLNNTISVMSLENEENNLTNIETNLDQDVRLTMLELGVI